MLLDEFVSQVTLEKEEKERLEHLEQQKRKAQWRVAFKKTQRLRRVQACAAMLIQNQFRDQQIQTQAQVQIQIQTQTHAQRDTLPAPSVTTCHRPA